MSANAAKTRSLPLDRLKEGVILRAPICDEETGTLLIATGQQLSSAVLEKLRQRGVRNVLISELEFARLTAGEARFAAAGSPAKKAPRLDVLTRDSGEDEYATSNPLIRRLKKPVEVLPSAEREAEFSAKFQQSIVDLQSVSSKITSGKGLVNQKVLLESAARSVAQILDDIDGFARMSMKAQVGQYPFSHSLQLANLATAVGVVLELDERALGELAIGCMLHDLGMIKIAPKLLNCERPLDVVEKLDITKHPAATFDMIGKIDGLAQGSRMVAYQMHERLDGSGYPRKRTASQIHPFSKIAMVCDCFIAMTSARPHRPPIPPYCAMVELLELAYAGKLDVRAVRGLLYCVSLFPLGSHVNLSDGRVAKVLRSNREKFTQPVVDAWSPEGADQSEVIDLAERDDLTILNAIVPPQFEQTRSSGSESKRALVTTEFG